MHKPLISNCVLPKEIGKLLFFVLIAISKAFPWLQASIKSMTFDRMSRFVLAVAFLLVEFDARFYVCRICWFIVVCFVVKFIFAKCRSGIVLMYSCSLFCEGRNILNRECTYHLFALVFYIQNAFLFK